MRGLNGDGEMPNRSMSQYRCHEHGIVEARQVAEEVRR